MVGRVAPALFAGLLAGGAGCTPSDGGRSTVDPSLAPPPTEAVADLDVGGDRAAPTTLANGLRVRITPIADATTVAIVMNFDVGSRHDPPGRSGLAHLAEHLLVTAATSAEPARSVDELVARYPLGWNAQTGSEYTVVATVVDPGEVDGELALMAARLAGVSPTQADLDRERPRILAEVDNMWGGIPSLAVVNAAKERVAPTPHGGRRGGDPATLAAVSLDELTEWLGYYNPTNATLSVAGPVDPDAVTASVSAAFGSLPAGVTAPAPFATPPGSAGITTIEAPPSAPGIVAVAYPVPDPGSDGFLPLLVAAHRLFSADPAAGLTSTYAPIDDPATLVVSAPLLPREDPADGARRVAAEVEQIVSGPLADGELDRALVAFGPLLGLGPNPFNPYATAFATARAHQLALDPSTAGERDEAAYAAAVDRIFTRAELAGATIGSA